MFEIKIVFDMFVNGSIIVVKGFLLSDRDLRNGRDEIDLFLNLRDWLKDHAGARTTIRSAIL